MSINAQTPWERFDKLMTDGSYKSAYELAEGVYKKSTVSAERLAAAYHMAVAAARYQEDARDSAEARYRDLLPSLAPLEKSLCHAFLGEYDEALKESEVLKQTPVEAIAMYCDGVKTRNVTPTAYDVVVLKAQDDYGMMPQQRVEMQRKLVAFHEKDGDNVRIWHELRLLDFLASVPNQHIDASTYRQSIDKFRGTKSGYYTQLYHKMAQYLSGKEEYVEAVHYCDTAIQLAPKSEGGMACANLKDEIQRKRIDFEGQGLWIIPGQASLQRVRYRNLDHLYYRIVNYMDDFQWGDKTKAKLLSAKAVASGQWPLVIGQDYKYAESYVALPALPTGRWLLLVSPDKDFKVDGFMAYEVNSTDMLLVQHGHEGLLLDRRTGRPVVGQKMRVERERYNEKVKVLATATTNEHGRYRFNLKESTWSDYIIIERDGYRLRTRFNYYDNKSDTTMRLQAQVRTDRPIYKPGDTVQVAVVAYRTNGLKAEAAKGQRLKLQFVDPNGEQVDHFTLSTDDYGVLHTRFVIPTDRLAGSYNLKLTKDDKYLCSEPVRVEEYKQPKFMVEIGGQNQEAGDVAPQFGKPYTVQGLAASYSAVPVGGARVQYHVVRRQLSRWWWRWWDYERETEVTEGETTTASDGSFSVVFTPEPDSSVELSGKPTFEYEIRVDVTDLNGESHEARTTLRVGYRNAFVCLEEGSTPDHLKVKHIDLNGNPLSGEIKTKVELLRQPVEPKLDNPLLRYGVHHTLTEAEWNHRFPLLAYGREYNDHSHWPVDRALAESSRQPVPTGVYRVTLSADGADTVTDYITYVAPDASKVPSQKLLWAEVDKSKADVGETVRLRFGSRFKDVELYYMLRVGQEERRFRQLRLTDEIKAIDIPVDSTMLGGFRIDLLSVREGVEEQRSFTVDVPFSHKQLKMEITTFRDKLQPGETEEWTIKVKREKSGEEEPAAVIMTMYDDALNAYGSSRPWGFSPWRTNTSGSLSPLHLSGGVGRWMNSGKQLYYQGNYPSVWMLKEALPYYRRPYGRRVYRSASMAKNNVMDEEVELAVVEDAVLYEDEVQVEGAMLKTASASAAGGDRGSQEVQVRTNLNTLAFFAPTLRTDKDGTATYRFTVPELLTRWNVRGLAVTDDIKTGTLDRTLVTSKPLMVQPNMPRFLRSGDSLSLMAKVVTGEQSSPAREVEVEVSFLLTDAATGDTICRHTEQVMLKQPSAGGTAAAQVTFDVEVPQNVHVATYKIVAAAEGMSDGEQGQLPVLSNRQAVTLSQALYINGIGEKQYTMPEWLEESPTREPQLVAAEVVSHPLWLAVKCMPYLKTHENPSSLYLANQLYINGKGKEIMGTIGNIGALGDGISPLRMNEDVRQTLLKATPWVQDAQSEEEQMAAVANYFDPERLDAELKKTTSELANRQNPDGGWSWMPDGKSSLWITQQILQRVAAAQSLSHSVTQSLQYVDREQQKYYERYIKPHLQKGEKSSGLRRETSNASFEHLSPTDIDYLYTRSLYGDASTEAYKYHYNNALKRYADFNNLYTQAQLALILHRHGDRPQALDILRRIKEKSLVSDEMGMYWRDNTSGWLWYQRPIETQALLIQTFAEITPDDHQSIALMQQWLLKQKQTTQWGNDAATAAAITALFQGESLKVKGESSADALQLTVFGQPLTSHLSPLTGHRSQRWTGNHLDTLLSLRSSTITLKKSDDGIAWGTVYYQFTDNIDKIPSLHMGITLRRTYIGPKEPHVGDKLKVRIDITCDRTMEYLELIDGRPSCLEPLSTRAGWRWNDGLSYYIVVNNTDTRCYIDRLEKGKYYLEYEVYLTNPGRFTAPPVLMQCLYAPEFRSASPTSSLSVLP